MFSVGTTLYYVNKRTGRVETVIVDKVDDAHFFFYFNGQKWRGDSGTIGTRLFTTRTAAVRVYNMKRTEREKYRELAEKLAISFPWQN